MRVLVTGAMGFIGTALCRTLSLLHHEVRRVVRQKVVSEEGVFVADIATGDGLKPALEAVDVVVHLVGVAHAKQSWSEYRRINVDATENLAKTAAQAGVKRFIFLSSIKANGEETAGRSFTEQSVPHPEDAYGISKLQAEKALFRLAEQTKLEVVVIRPPLVYGPGVKGNLLRLLRWIENGWPVPVPLQPNRRSLIGVENLSGLIARCLDHPQAINQSFLAADGEDLSSEDLVRIVADLLGKRAFMVRLPTSIARPVARLLGHEAMLRRMFGSLQVDATKAQQLLGWQPSVSVREGLERMAVWFRASAI